MKVRPKPVVAVAKRTPENEILDSLRKYGELGPYNGRTWVRGCGTWCSKSKEEWARGRTTHKGILLYSGVDNPEQDLQPTTDTFVQLQTQSGPLYLLLKEA